MRRQSLPRTTPELAFFFFLFFPYMLPLPPHRTVFFYRLSPRDFAAPGEAAATAEIRETGESSCALAGAGAADEVTTRTTRPEARVAR